ncbi:MAG TPA: hypothetical protein VIA45_13750 [Thermoanaerobaculia bacterium]|jgi:hypothetical protein
MSDDESEEKPDFLAPDLEDEGEDAVEGVPAGTASEASAPAPAPDAAPAPSSGVRPTPLESREPLYCEAGGFRMRLEPADLARLRELPGSKGKSDRTLGEEFFEKLAPRFARSLAEDVTPPAEVRVVVDPYSRQAFLAIERTIRSILSF